METLQDNFNCPICLEISKEAVESTCCGNIYCEQCAKLIQNKKCALCQSPQFQFTITKSIRRMINNLQVSCSKCNEKSTVENLKNHKYVCLKEQLTYKINKCDFQGNGEDLLKHSIEKHKIDLIKFSLNENENKQLVVNKSKYDPTKSLLNQNQQMARLGQNGKFYCGQKLEGPCSCNGFCGPSNGCNCKACMILDLEQKGLDKQLHLINRLGNIAIMIDNKYYCGILIQKQKSCKKDQLQCTYCEELTNLKNYRYNF